MKEETKKQVRIAIVGLFGVLALICATSEPINQETWFKDFFISKTIAALSGMSHTGLRSIGNQRGFCLKWMMKYDKN